MKICKLIQMKESLHLLKSQLPNGALCTYMSTTFPKIVFGHHLASQLTRVAIDEALQISVGVSGRDVVAAVVHSVDLIVLDMAAPLRLPVLSVRGCGGGRGEVNPERMGQGW